MDHRPDNADPHLHELGEPQVMRALAHPVRLALVEVLTYDGPLTATEAGERIDESPTTCSFHLRQLAKYGLVEEAGGGRGRARPWRMRQLGLSLPEVRDVEQDVAGQLFLDAALRRQVERHVARRRGRAAYPDSWAALVTQSDTVCWVTETEAAELRERLLELVMKFHDRLDPARRPAETHPVEFFVLMHPFADPSAYE